MPVINRRPDSVIAAAVWMIELMALVKGAMIEGIEKGDIEKAMVLRRDRMSAAAAFKTIFGDRT